MKRSRFILAAIFVISVSSVGFGQVTIIDDNLNMDTSSDYTVVNGGFDGGGDGTLEWAYDYSADGIPTAPGTTDGSTTGVKMSVNNTSGFTEAYTIFHNTELVGVTDYSFTIDVWSNVWAAGDVGSTEHVQVGVGADNTIRNHLFEFGNAGQDPGCCEFSGSGHFLAASSDGGDSSDFRHWRDNANGSGNPGPVNQFDPDYLAPDMNTNVTGDNFEGFFDQISNIDAPIFGAIGNGWATIRVEVSQTDQKLRYYVRGYLPETTGALGSTDAPEFLQIVESDLFDAEGFANFGLADLNAGSASVPEDQFTVFDNFFIEGSNLPGGGGVDGDFDDNGLYECNDVDQLVAAIVDVKSGGAPDLNFDLDDDGTVGDADLVAWLAEAGDSAGGGLTASGNPVLVGDATLDGTVDGLDFIEWNDNKFTNTAAWCAGDFNADGAIDGLDFIEWNNTKFTTADGVSGVPEPSGILMLFIAIPLLVRRR